MAFTSSIICLFAAEAAQQRQAQPVAQPPEPVPCVPPPPTVQVTPLVDTCFSLVLDRITDPANPIRSVGRMPHDICERIINHLLRQKLLDPKTVKIFLSRLAKTLPSCL